MKRAVHRRCAAAVLIATALSTCGSEPCTGCPVLADTVCACFGDEAPQCAEARQTASQLCDDNPDGAHDACAAALTGFDCAREQREGGSTGEGPEA